MIRMSYFAKYKGPDGVSIARFPPKWLPEIPTYLDIAPSREILLRYKDDGDKRAYFNAYLKQLASLDLSKIYSDLDGKVILCYEKPGDFCHRFIFQAVMRKAGFEVEEIQ